MANETKQEKRNKLQSYFRKVKKLTGKYTKPFAYKFVAKQIKGVYTLIGKIGNDEVKKYCKEVKEAIDEQDAEKYEQSNLMVKDKLSDMNLFGNSNSDK